MSQWEMRKQELTNKRDQFHKSMTSLEGKAAYLDKRKRKLAALLKLMAKEDIPPSNLGIENIDLGGHYQGWGQDRNVTVQ